MGQLTRAWREDGSLRFDALADMKRKYPKDLYELNWSTVYDRPDLQIRTMVLMSKANYSLFLDTKDPLAFADSAYNGGAGDVRRSRTACKISGKCDPNYWFGHVENYSVKSRKILYANRSALDINNHHVKDVLKVRTPKYVPLLNN